MASNIYHFAEPDTNVDQQLCIAGFCFSDRFVQMVSGQTSLAYDRDGEITVWMSLSDRKGNGGVISLMSPKPRKIPFQGQITLAHVLKPRCDTTGNAVRHELTALRRTGPDTLSLLPPEIGMVASICLAPEITQLTAQLWVARHSATDWTALDLERMDQLACVLGAMLDREIDLMLRERAQWAEHRMTDLSHRIADIFSAPGLPISERFRSMLDTCCTAFEMDCGYVTLNHKGKPRIQFGSTQLTHNPASDPAPRGPSFSKHLMEDKMPLAVWDVAASRHNRLGVLSSAPVGRFLGCPIRFDGRTHGTIELFASTAASAPYTQSETAMMRTLSIYAAGPLVLLGDALSY